MKIFRRSLALVVCAACLNGTGFAQTPPANTTPALTPGEVRSRINPKFVELVQLSRMPISASVKDADIVSVIRTIADAHPKGLRVTVRNPSNFMITCKLDKVPLGDVLLSIAKLSNCNLYLVSDLFVIAPPFALTEDEKKVALNYEELRRRGNQSPETARDEKMYAAIRQVEILVPLGTQKQAFDTLSKEAQRAVLNLMNIRMSSQATQLGAGATISLFQNAGRNTLEISDPAGGQSAIWFYDPVQTNPGAGKAF